MGCFFSFLFFIGMNHSGEKIPVPGDFETLGLGWGLSFSRAGPQHSQHLSPSSARPSVYLPCSVLAESFAYGPLPGQPFLVTGGGDRWVERCLNPGC